MDNLLGRAQPTLLQELTLPEKLQVVIEQGGRLWRISSGSSSGLRITQIR